jgi:hypothetical protein
MGERGSLQWNPRITPLIVAFRQELPQMPAPSLLLPWMVGPRLAKSLLRTWEGGTVVQ